MPTAKPTGLLVLNYDSADNRPVGGFRLYYQPVEGEPINEDCPSIPIGYSGPNNSITEDAGSFTVSVILPYLLPSFKIASGQTSRYVIFAAAPIDAAGNQGELSEPISWQITAPSFDPIEIYED